MTMRKSGTSPCMQTPWDQLKSKMAAAPGPHVGKRAWFQQSFRVGHTLAKCYVANSGGIPIEHIIEVVQKAQLDGWLIGKLSDVDRAKWMAETVSGFLKCCPKRLEPQAQQFAIYLQDELDFRVLDNRRYCERRAH